MIADIISSLFISMGMFFALTSTLGIFRLPTFFSKVHAAGLADSAGATLFLIGSAIQYGISFNAVKIIFIMLLIWVGSTTATYAICSAKFKKDKILEKK